MIPTPGKLTPKMMQAKTAVPVMDSDCDEGYIRDRCLGTGLQMGRRFLMDNAESRQYVQVVWVSTGQDSR